MIDDNPMIRAGMLLLTLVAVTASMGCPGPDNEIGSATATETNDDTSGGTQPTSGTVTEGATEPAGESQGEWPIVVCEGTPCAAGEFCLRPVPACQLVPDPCSGGDSGTDTGTGGTSTTGDEPEDQCWIEVDPTSSCMPIPTDCQGTLAEIAACLEAFGPCPDGGTITDGVLRCRYNSIDGCEEGESPYYTCQPCL